MNNFIWWHDYIYTDWYFYGVEGDEITSNYVLASINIQAPHNIDLHNTGVINLYARAANGYATLEEAKAVAEALVAMKGSVR